MSLLRCIPARELARDCLHPAASTRWRAKTHMQPEAAVEEAQVGVAARHVWPGQPLHSAGWLFSSAKLPALRKESTMVIKFSLDFARKAPLLAPRERQRRLFFSSSRPPFAFNQLRLLLYDRDPPVRSKGRTSPASSASFYASFRRHALHTTARRPSMNLPASFVPAGVMCLQSSRPSCARHCH
jgi:hypothetical protein